MSIQPVTLAYSLMIAIGICGVSFVVPLNALLQKCGHESIGAGNAQAVQNFAMLLFVGMYSRFWSGDADGRWRAGEVQDAICQRAVLMQDRIQ